MLLNMKRRSQPTHDRMVSQIAQRLRDLEGYKKVQADLPAYTKPDTIYWSSGGGHIPDVTAWNNIFHIFEVETDDSIDDAHTDDQWKLFAAYAAKFNAVFYAVVPRGYKWKTELQLTKLNITAEVIEI